MIDGRRLPAQWAAVSACYRIIVAVAMRKINPFREMADQRRYHRY